MCLCTHETRRLEHHFVSFEITLYDRPSGQPFSKQNFSAVQTELTFLAAGGVSGALSPTITHMQPVRLVVRSWELPPTYLPSRSLFNAMLPDDDALLDGKTWALNNVGWCFRSWPSHWKPFGNSSENFDHYARFWDTTALLPPERHTTNEDAFCKFRKHVFVVRLSLSTSC